MSAAADRLARTRLAIIAHVQQRKGGEPAGAQAERDAQGREADSASPGVKTHPAGPGRWLRRLKRLVAGWWRSHPARAGLELATPVLSGYAARKPVQFLGMAAAAGALLVLSRSWRLISVTGILVALLKSSELSGILLSALSEGDSEKDDQRSG